MLFLAASASASTADELRSKIDAQNQKIKDLEQEIARYEAELISIGKNKTTLESEVARLDTSRKKINADISVTQQKITSATLEIESLGGQISDKELRAETARQAILESMRSLQRAADATLVEKFFGADDVATLWEDADRLLSLQNRMDTEIVELHEVREALAEDRDAVSEQKSTLSAFQSVLVGQRAVLDQNRKEQAALLQQTKSKESEYQKIIEAKREARAQFEQELNEFESQLAFTLDPSKLPSPGSGVLQFPLDRSFMQRCAERERTFKNLYCITQYFGDTAFARSGAYNGKGHNGVDFGAPAGTAVLAALSGTVVATGNTDAFPGCYSYGKWVLIKHANGLSSLYAHLSYIAVGANDSLPTGAVIGYSGNTGYSTGPHLHFTLYASEGVQLLKLGDLKAKTNCAQAVVPVAPTSAYLNPLSYL